MVTLVAKRNYIRYIHKCRNNLKQSLVTSGEVPEKELLTIREKLLKNGLSQNILDKIDKCGQNSILRFVEEYSNNEVKSFIEQLNLIDFELIKHVF